MPNKKIMTKSKKVIKSVAKNLGGRPSKYPDVVTQKNIVKMYNMASLGKTIAQLCVAIGICQRTYMYWVHQYPKFLHIHNMCKTKRDAYWDKEGHDNLTTSKYQSSLYLALRRNMSNWHLNQYAIKTDFLPRDVLKQLLKDDKGNKLSVEEKMNKLNELQLELGLNATAVKKQLECLRIQLDVENERRGQELENDVRHFKKLAK